MPIQEGGKFSPTQRIVSPGVFTRENDLTISGLAQGVANIGGAIVAPFPDGPAFQPTFITDLVTLEQRFGVADGVYYGPYAAKEYLLQQGAVTIVRVGGLTGYWQKNPLIVYAEPGVWVRTDEVGALTTSSYMFVDSTNYLSNIVYKHNSTPFVISGSSVDGNNATVNDGVSVSATIATKSDILAFLASYSYLPNIDNLSSSLGKALKDRKLISVVTNNLYSAFSASVADKGLNLCPENGASDYALAWFDIKNFIPSGSLYFAEDASGTNQETKNIASILNGTWSGGTKTWSAGSGSYLTASIVQVNGQVKFPFVFLSSGVSTGKNVGYSYNEITGALDKNPFNLIASYDTSYMYFSGSVSAKFGSGALTSDYPGDYDGTGKLSGSATYAGKQVSLGEVYTGKLVRKFTGLDLGDFANAVGYFYMTSSLQGKNLDAETKVAAAFEESTSTLNYLSSSVLNTGATTSDITVDYDTSTFDSETGLTVKSASFKAVRDEDSCNVNLKFLGIVSGQFGTFTGTFVPGVGATTDPCSISYGDRKNMVLAVLANTQNASTVFDKNYEVQGFVGSIITQLTSSMSPYKGTINPNENKYQLMLKYRYTNASGTVEQGTYGCYDFSLNDSDNGYIKDVFGTNPTVGNPAKQLVGAKIEAAYNYVLFEDSIKRFIAEKTRPNAEGGGWRLSVATAPSAGFSVGESMKFVDQYSYNPTSGDSQFSITNAKTPWIYSQKTTAFKCEGEEGSGNIKYKLFRLHTLDDGTVSNQKYKIEISNVKLAGTVPGSKYGSFTLAVRKFDDNDKRPQYIELYQNLNLDPDSSNFIARRIGDRYSYITAGGKIVEYGDYTNLSRTIRVEMTDVTYPESAVPYGFEAYSSPVDGTLSTLLPAVRYSKASIYGKAPGKYPSGTVFSSGVPDTSLELASLYPTSSYGVGVDRDTKNWFKPLPYYGGNDENGSNIDFDLEDKVWGVSEAAYYGHGTRTTTGSILAPSLSGSIPSVYDAVNEPTYVKLRKFVFGFQGGFDGQWPALPVNVGSDITPGNTQGLDCTNITSPGTIAYKQCIDALGNSEAFDINLIVLPGIFREQHKLLTDLTVEMVENRGDCFYIMDNVVFPASGQTAGLIDAAIECIKDLDTNYVATYYPWVKILDQNTNKIVSVPPSVIIPSVFAANDNAAAEWYAPAGLNRGGIPQATQVLDRLSHDERDTLYENRINPIAAFPGQGICVWGQKTLQVESSALDRINVRRLLINLKKFVASTSNYLVFEQNIASTRNRFLAVVNPYLESVQQRNGIYAYQVKMDDTNNTQDLVDRGTIYGQIFIQPTRTAEFIILDFNILPTGASFNI